MHRLRRKNESDFISILRGFESSGLNLQILWESFVDQLPPEKKAIAEVATLSAL